LQQTEKNFKGRLIEFTQKAGMNLDFNVTELSHGKQKIYKLTVIIDDKIFGEAEHTNKKQAEQQASEKALIQLKTNPQNSVIEKVMLIETPIVLENQYNDSIEPIEEHQEILDENLLKEISNEVPERIEEQKNMVDENPNEETLAIEPEIVKEQENQVL
jgi:hypothetical protein